ncbi:MBL fold metallo-hydrolase [Devosia ginsengisoli]|uniref:MBL fold metallo-hydrolase n=1 Tax=Devosia ginsengisoli TaxID=400770 RepID=UPI0026E9BDFD|nr:MBL fold metallo-hydrolase [Devosia ginsengisoli]MCR6671274.1 MBL fold metallo-hydrolase [Devosia ginsengisoli]
MVKRRDVVAGLATLPLAGTVSFMPVWAQEPMTLEGDAIPTSDGDIIIHPVDHASLVLGFGDAVIYADPVGGAALYEGLPPPTAILVTHGHGDHFDVPTLEAIAGSAPILTSQEVFDKLPEALKANATAIANGEDTSLDGIAIRAIAAHNITEDRMQYHPVGAGNGYVLTLGDKQVYIAGDTEPTDDMLALTDIAVAFLPMNLPYTMTPEQAAEAINTFKPAIAYPYHYGDSDLAPLETVGDHTEVRLRDWYASGA